MINFGALLRSPLEPSAPLALLPSPHHDQNRSPECGRPSYCCSRPVCTDSHSLPDQRFHRVEASGDTGSRCVPERCTAVLGRPTDITLSAGNQTLNPLEVAYVQDRAALVPDALSAYLESHASTVYAGNISSANASSFPVVGIALSGGGNRAALYGAGVLAALDGRHEPAVEKGTGGLLQAATYISGLSG